MTGLGLPFPYPLQGFLRVSLAGPGCAIAPTRRGATGSWLLVSNSWTDRSDWRGHRRNVAAFGSRSPRMWLARRAGDRGGGSGFEVPDNTSESLPDAVPYPGNYLLSIEDVNGLEKIFEQGD